MTILELREKRAKAWEAAKAFLDSHRNDKGILSAEDDATYTRMEQDITDLGKEIARLERQEALDAELSKPTATPLTGKPLDGKADERTGRATDEYRSNFWNAMRTKNPTPQVVDALRIGADTEGGYLVPDEYERTLVEALEEENIFRPLAHVIRTASGERKIPVVSSKGTASWIEEGGAFPESNDTFGQVTIGAYKLGTTIKISEELLNDSVFDLENYIAREFARRIGTKEKEAFFTGDGSGKSLGVLADKVGAEVGVTAASATAITADELLDLYHSLFSPYRKKAVWVVNDSTIKAVRKLKDNNWTFLSYTPASPSSTARWLPMSSATTPTPGWISGPVLLMPTSPPARSTGPLDSDTLVFEVRWCEWFRDLDSTKFRILFGGNIYNIACVDDVQFRHKKLTAQRERR